MYYYCDLSQSHCAPQGSSAESEESEQPGGDSVEEIPGSQLLWKIKPRPANSAQVSPQPEHTHFTAIFSFFITRLLHSGDSLNLTEICVSFSFSAADVQFHIIRHAAKRAG